MNTKEKIAVMQAFADGKPIQFIPLSGEYDWMQVDNPKWCWDTYDYRVAKLTGTFLEIITALKEKRISKAKNGRGIIISSYNGKFIAEANWRLGIDDYLDKWTEC